MKLLDTVEKRLFEILERRKAIRAFEQYVSPGVMKLIEKPVDIVELPRSPQKKHFQFIVVNLDHSNADAVSDSFESVFKVMTSHNAISSALPLLIIAWLGAPFPEYDSADKRLDLVGALLAQHGVQIRIAHGQCDGLIGNFGGPSRFVYGVTIPGFSEILRRLLDTPFGSATEIH